MSYPPGPPTSMLPPVPPPPPAPPPVAKAGIRPGKKWYWLGGLAIAVGIIGGIALIIGGVVNLSRTVDGFARFKAPATKTLEFQKAGTYTVYYEYQGEVCGDQAAKRDCVQLSAPENPPRGLQVVLKDSAGTTVPIDTSSTEEISFSFDDRAGKAYGEFRIPAPGDYLIAVTSPGSQPFGIAIGKGVIGDLVRWVLGGLALAVLGLALGLVAIIVTAVKRGRRRRELQRQQWAATYGVSATADTAFGATAPFGPSSPYAPPNPYWTPTHPPAGAPEAAPPPPPPPPPPAGGTGGGWGPPPPDARLDDDGA